MKNHDKNFTRKKTYSNNRYRTDIDFRLICNTSRIRLALNGKTKSSSTLDFSGIDIDLYRKWIESQFTPEMNWLIIEIDHVKQICMFDISNDEDLRECFN